MSGDAPFWSELMKGPAGAGLFFVDGRIERWVTTSNVATLCRWSLAATPLLLHLTPGA